MIQKYTFYDGGTVEFEDSRSVRELIAYAFAEFGYYEPLGMDCVTVFQGHHPATHVGWFTQDTGRSCASEITNRDDLYFAYHIPGVLYYAEGGWGHHMGALGNHPELEDAVCLYFRAEDFNHTLVLNGNLPMERILALLQEAEYLPGNGQYLTVRAVNPYSPPYRIALSDPLMMECAAAFERSLPEAVTILCMEGETE